MKNYLLHTSEGVKDCYGVELEYKEIINSNTKSLFKSHGYQFIETPTFEYIDVFTHGNKGLQKPELYNLINRKGEVLALKSDMTSAIARVVASEHINSANVLKKYAYITNTFRYPDEYQGKAHEFTQAGVELIGINNINADLEIIRLVIEYLEVNQIKDYSIHIGNAEFINGLIDMLICNKENNDSNLKETIFSIIESKDFVYLKSFLHELSIEEEIISLLMEILQTGGRISFLNRIIEKINKPEVVKSLNYLKLLFEELINEGLENHILIDFSIYSHLKYYTGIIFQVFVKGEGDVIITGGRYDNLLKSFGVNLPAIGFGIHIGQLVNLLMRNNVYKNNTSQKILVIDNKNTRSLANSNSKALRELGYVVEKSLYDDINVTKRHALEKEFSVILNYCLGEDILIYNVCNKKDITVKNTDVVLKVQDILRSMI